MDGNAANELDEERVEELYTRLERPLFNVAYRYLWNADEARDLVQEAFLRLWATRKRVRAGTVEPLVYRITLNLARNRRRSRRLWAYVGLDAVTARSGGAGPDERLVAAGEHARLRTALETLPERLRRTVLLCELSDLTQPEIGRILGIPAGTVASRRNRALRLLRKQLDPRGAGS